MWKVVFGLISRDFFAYRRLESCVFVQAKAVQRRLVFHIPDFSSVILRTCVEKLGMIGRNFLLGCGQTVEKKISAVYCVKNTYPQDVCKSVDNLA